MNTFPKSIKTAALASAILGASSLWAAVFSVTDTLSSDNTVEDPTIPGLARTLTVSTSVTQLTGLSITLDLSSAVGDTAWNGDLYAQLTSPSGTLSVLLNQSGVTGSNPGGYGNAGYTITLDTSASNDIHFYQDVSYSLNGGGQLTGTWQSDGRTDATSSTRDKLLSQFLGENPNGVWTLFVSDLANGNRAQLNSWTISGIGTAVPEPQFAALAIGAALTGFGIWRGVRKASA